MKRRIVTFCNHCHSLFRSRRPHYRHVVDRQCLDIEEWFEFLMCENLPRSSVAETGVSPTALLNESPDSPTPVSSDPFSSQAHDYDHGICRPYARRSTIQSLLVRYGYLARRITLTPFLFDLCDPYISTSRSAWLAWHMPALRRSVY